MIETEPPPALSTMADLMSRSEAFPPALIRPSVNAPELPAVTVPSFTEAPTVSEVAPALIAIRPVPASMAPLPATSFCPARLIVTAVAVAVFCNVFTIVVAAARVSVPEPPPSVILKSFEGTLAITPPAVVAVESVTVFRIFVVKVFETEGPV